MQNNDLMSGDLEKSPSLSANKPSKIAVTHKVTAIFILPHTKIHTNIGCEPGHKITNLNFNEQLIYE